jgi:succinate-acetate transporter protein
MIWLGKFYADFIWIVWRNVSNEGLKALIKFWTVVDALNLVCHEICDMMVSFSCINCDQVLMTVFVALRLTFVLYVSNNILKVPTNR